LPYQNKQSLHLINYDVRQEEVFTVYISPSYFSLRLRALFVVMIDTF